MLDRKLELWKAKLLDLSLRNRLINFKEGRSLIQLAVNDPASFYEDIVEKDKTFSFKSSKDSTSSKPNLLSHTLTEKEAYKRLYKIYLSSRESLTEQAVNTLYISFGMLEYDEPDSDMRLRAPLVMVPVKIDRKKSSPKYAQPFEITFLEDDIYINPALRQKLINHYDVDIDLPFESLEDYYSKLKPLISERGWVLDENAVYMGIFAFQKLSLYKDLITHKDLITQHPIIRKLAGEDVELPAPSIEEDLDDLDPKTTFHVLDADSSQQKAILAARKGYSFVLQGPPGTGKSQTIANIIAQLLADGKKILFVSEKMAALEAVKKRLDAVGIGHYLLEMHNASSNGKKWVLEQLERALSENKLYEHDERLIEQLSEMRRILRKYGKELLNSEDFPIPPYLAYGRLARLSKVKFPDIGVDLPLDFEGFKQNISLLEELDQDQLSEYSTSIFKYLNNRDYSTFSDLQRQKFKELLEKALEYIEYVKKGSSTLHELLGITFKCMEDLSGLDNKLSVFMNAEIPEGYDITPNWFTVDVEEVLKILERLKLKWNESTVIYNYFESKYSPEIYSIKDLDDIYTKLTKNYSLLPTRWVDPRYKAIENQFQDLLRDKTKKLSYDDLVNDVKQLITLERVKEDIAKDEEYIKELLHINYVEIDSLLSFYRWLDHIKKNKLFNPHIVKSIVEGKDIKGPSKKFIEDVDRFVDVYLKITELFIGEAVERIFRFASWDKLDNILKYTYDHLTEIPKWVEFKNTLSKLPPELQKVFDRAMADKNRNYKVSELYEKLFLLKYLDSIELVLSRKSREYLDMVRDKFMISDREHKYYSRSKIIEMIESKKPKLSLTSSSSEVGILKKELGKSRRHKPLRRLFEEIKNLVFVLKPCFMMSPLSVATFIDPKVINFDVVIFDEASQVMVEDAISSILRAKQVIIVGDSKQLPPTTFFKVNEDIDVEEDLEDAESILDEASTILGSHMLRWHYRSKCESLIGFSNEHFYNHDLITFPNSKIGHFAIDFVHVPDGIYDRGGTRQNKIEAKRVVELVKEHFDKTPNKSLGVLAFSIAQQQAILDELDEFLRANPEYSSYINDDSLSSFFVKNLETVQGDERDVIILSLGYGRDQEGNISLNFGPLNKEGGVKRLNVAITRAIEKIIVVSSILPEDINESKTSSEGLKMLKRYLEYARSRSTHFLPKSSIKNIDDLQQSVYDRLKEAGLDVDMNVGASKFKIDVAVKDPKDPSKYALAIELDGNVFKNAPSSRDRERIRREVLEALGWKVHRIWAHDWVINMDLEVQTILELVNGAQSKPSDSKKEEKRKRIDFFDEDLLKIIKDYPNVLLPSRPGGEREYYGLDFFKLVREVIENEAPIHRELVMHRILDMYGLKATKKAVDRFNEILRIHLPAEGIYLDDDDIFWTNEPVFAINIRRSSVDVRPLQYIPPAELRLAVLIVVDNAISIDRDDIPKDVAKLFGGRRTTPKFKALVGRLVDELIQKGFLSTNEEGKIILNRRDQS